MRREKESDWEWVAISATLWGIKLELGLGLELESGTVTVSSLKSMEEMCRSSILLWANAEVYLYSIHLIMNYCYFCYFYHY